MKRKCVMCSTWVIHSSARKLSTKQKDYAEVKKNKLNDGDSFICKGCYFKLYKADVKEPSGIATADSEPSVAGPSGTTSSGIHDLNQPGDAEPSAVTSMTSIGTTETLFDVEESSSSQSIGTITGKAPPNNDDEMIKQLKDK